MSSFRVIAVAIVVLCIFGASNVAEAKGSKGKASQKHVDKDTHRRHKPHAKQRRRHEESDEESYDDHDGHHKDHDDRYDSRHVNYRDKVHDGQRRRHEEFHDEHEDRHERHDRDHESHDRHHGDYDPHHGDLGHPRDMQRLNERRKLKHRLGQAEHLQRISERNGNPHLAETAQRMEHKAWEHYRRRMQEIDPHESPYDFPRDRSDEQDPPSHWHSDHQGDSPSTTWRPRSGSSELGDDRFQGRLFSEQRELRRRLDTADRMRRLGRLNGDQQLVESADRIEDFALQRFDQRMQRLREPLSPAEKSQLDDYFERSVTSAMDRERDRAVIRRIGNFEDAVRDPGTSWSSTDR